MIKFLIKPNILTQGYQIVVKSIDDEEYYNDNTEEDYGIFDEDDEDDEDDEKSLKEDKDDKDEESDFYTEDVDAEYVANMHPAERAARYRGGGQHKIGCTDDLILRDLRKMVFSVPMMHQKEVLSIFEKIDKLIVSSAYKIIGSSSHYLEDLVQIIIKVGAGNTYGKNIYEKEDDPNKVLNQVTTKVTKTKETYKPHEIKFLANSHLLLYKCATKNLSNIEKSLDRCAFIRGIYEDILKRYVSDTQSYKQETWMALEAKITNNLQKLAYHISNIAMLEKSKDLGHNTYGLVVMANQNYNEFLKLRSKVSAPYLRSVYTQAKHKAKSAHQILENFQNGSFGLYQAVSCYSTKRIASFASVAKSWIKQRALLSIKEDANFVKLPISTWQAHTSLEKAREKILCGNQEEDIQAIAKIAKMSVQKAKSVYDTVKIAQVYSLNKTYDTEEKLTLEDMKTNEDKLGYVDDYLSQMLRDYCEHTDLNKQEIMYLALRHGMPDLIPQEKLDVKSIIRESIVQNLASLGYNYKFK